MTLEEVIAEVKREGQHKADAIAKKGGKESQQILSQAEAEAAALLEKERARAESDAQRLREMELAAAETEGNKLVMGAKRKLHDQVRERSLRQLAEAQGQHRERMLSLLIEKGLRELPGARIRCVKADETVVRARSKGSQVVADLEAAGGVVLESPDGKVSLTMTYEAMLEDAWAGSLPKVARELGL
jgi:vacuolar-type H+-ATPase subunit E/Vma4